MPEPTAPARFSFRERLSRRKRAWERAQKVKARLGPADRKAVRGFHGYYLLIHRIKPWLVKRCALDAGEFCTVY
jgi:hypothetical protein